VDVDKMDSEELIILGKVNGFYGVKGWVKLFSHTEPKENIVKYCQVLLQLPNQSQKGWQNFEMSQGRLQGKGVVAHFKGFDDRDSAQALLGADIAVPRSRLAKLAKDDYYWIELIGLEVINTDDIRLGKVTNIMETGANDVLVVKPENAQVQGLSDEYLIPYVPEQFILDIDLETRIIRVDWDKDF